MRTEISYETVLSSYRHLISDMYQIKTNSSSRMKNTPFSECKWYIEWGTVYRNSDPVLFGKSLDEKLEMTLRKVYLSQLVCKSPNGRGKWGVEFPVNTKLPQEVIAEIEAQCICIHAESVLIAGMSDRQRKREISQLVSELKQMGSFVCMKGSKSR